MTSLDFGSNFFNRLHLKPLLTNSINPPPFLSLSLRAPTSYPFIFNCANEKLLSSLVSLTTKYSKEMHAAHDLS